MKNSLEIVRAGAGSGKTTDLCQTVADAVSEGLDPSRILATTFTKRAAAELKSRIQARLLSYSGDRSSERQHADRLELAAIGTVHSVAHQLLSRYAIDMGLSPRLEAITEVAAEHAMRELLGANPGPDWKWLVECAERLRVNDLHSRILALLAAKRGNLISDSNFTSDMESSAKRVCELLAPEGVWTGKSYIDEFKNLLDQAIADLDEIETDTQKNTKKARQVLRKLKSKCDLPWGGYLEAAKINAGKKSGADAKLDALRICASKVVSSSCLHDDIRDFSSRLARETIRLDSLYKQYKGERGLIDYTDMETLLLELLVNEQLAKRIAEDFDLVLIDEFQDTNPLQLSIFQELRKLAPRNRWVGDQKQAIYGFRNTDPKLVDDIWNNSIDAKRIELPNNYRSQRGLVQLVGTLFEPIFGADAKQVPQRDELPKGIERWVFDTKNNDEDAMAMACGIAKLHAEGTRFGDILVLERANRQLPILSDALDTLGIPYLFESTGLFSTREGAVLLAGLRLVADRSDSLAAATVLHLMGDPDKDTPDWITERLETLAEIRSCTTDESPSPKRLPWEGDARFEGIENINRSMLSPTLIAQQVIERLDIPTLIQSWDDHARRCSNLDSILQHIREYEASAFTDGYAATLSGLILHLEQLEADELDLRFPPQGHDAVTLMTYHSAKGLEWPVVVLGGLDSSRSPDMWKPVVTGGGQQTSGPLDGRILRSWTWPFGQTMFGKLQSGSSLEDDGLGSEEGIERAKRDFDENMRLLYVGCTRAKHKLVFAHRQKKYDWLDQLDVDLLLSCDLDEGEHKIDGIDTTYVLRLLNADMVDSCSIEESSQERWISLANGSASLECSRRFHSPSAAPSIGEAVSFQIYELSGTVHYPSGAGQSQYAAIGDAVHGYLAALPSIQALDDDQKECIAERCLSAYSVTGQLAPSVLVSSGNRFLEWVVEHYPDAEWHVELPARGQRTDGGDWNGTVDLLLRLPNGNVVVIDHKSAPMKREHCESKAQQYSGQLSAYEELLSAAGESVEATWIHFPLSGVMAKREVH